MPPSTRIVSALRYELVTHSTHHRRQLLGPAEALGEQHALLQVGLELLRCLTGAVDRRVDQSRGHRVDADSDGGEVAGDGQRHSDDAALRRRVGGLADLPVEGGDRRHVDDRATLARFERLGRAHRRAGDANAVEAADQVDRDDLLEGVEVGCRLVRAVLADGALRPADPGRVDEDAQRGDRLGHLDRADDVVGVR